MKSTLTLQLLKYLYHDLDLTITQISEQTGFGTSTIHRALKKFNLLKCKSDIYQKIHHTRTDTFLRKYGSTHYMQSQEGYKQYKKALSKTTGVDNIMQLQSVREKQINTHIAKYGVPYSIQHPDSNNKRLNTLQETYGNYRKHLSQKSSKNHIKTQPNKNKLTLNGQSISVRSKLEKQVIEGLSKLSDVLSLTYESQSIALDDCYIIPDVFINHDIVIEIKYYKYLSNKPIHNLDQRGRSMRQSASRKVPKLYHWCNINNKKLYIITERDLKTIQSSNTLQELIPRLKISSSYIATFGTHQ